VRNMVLLVFDVFSQLVQILFRARRGELTDQRRLDDQASVEQLPQLCAADLQKDAERLGRSVVGRQAYPCAAVRTPFYLDQTLCLEDTESFAQGRRRDVKFGHKIGLGG